MDPRSNPYLAHMYEDGQQTDGARQSEPLLDGANNSAFAGFKRHNTTAPMARQAEDSKVNPFNGKSVSNKYFSILETRRDLPVHAQR